MLRKEKMETRKLYNIAKEEGITVDFFSLPEAKGLSLLVAGKRFIALDKGAVCGEATERVLLAHELGHHTADALYGIEAEGTLRKRKERRADRWAIERLVPYGELLDAIKQGDETVPFLADRFGVTEDFMQKALKFYYENKSA